MARGDAHPHSPEIAWQAPGQEFQKVSGVVLGNELRLANAIAERIRIFGI